MSVFFVSGELAYRSVLSIQERLFDRFISWLAFQLNTSITLEENILLNGTLLFAFFGIFFGLLWWIIDALYYSGYILKSVEKQLIKPVELIDLSIKLKVIILFIIVIPIPYLVFFIEFEDGETVPMVVLTMIMCWVFIPLGLILSEEIGRLGNIERKFYPNQGIWETAKNFLKLHLILSLYFALVCGLSSKLLFGDRVGILGVAIGLMGGMALVPDKIKEGGVAVIRHVALRIVIWLSGSGPWNYRQFLDYAKARRLLKKLDGGTYAFCDPSLREYFANHYERTLPDCKKN